MAKHADPPSPAPPDDYETEARRWLAEVYQGDKVRQLSVRSIVMGMLLGGILSVSNLYVGIRTGWNLGVTVTACIVAYAVFRALEAVVPAIRREPFTILENYTMSSAASAASFMSSAGLVSAIPALYIVNQTVLGVGQMMAWLAAVSLLGVFMAVPLKRQMINIEKLPFPSGTATAETLKSLHSSGAVAMQKARSLFWAMGIGAIVAMWREGMGLLGGLAGRITGSESIAGRFAAAALPDPIPLWAGDGGREFLRVQGIGWPGSLFMVGAGAIMGIRVTFWLLVGVAFFWSNMGYWLVHEHLARPGYTGIVRWTLWPATSLLVVSGLLSFAFRWRTILRSFHGLGALVKRDPGIATDPLDDIEVPGSWFAVGTIIAGIACVLLGMYWFQISWWMGIVAVLLSFFLSIVAARATGESDITPIGAMGKITQLTYGVIAPSNTTTNLMTACITAGSASHSADLLTDLKAGYLLGGNPRKQTISQLFGVLAGTLFCVPIYSIIVPPETIGTDKAPMPSAQVWAGVARLMAEGLHALPKYAVLGMAIGAGLGLLITLAEEFSPRKYRLLVPSAMGLGLAGVIPPNDSLAMFIGAGLAWCFCKAAPAQHEKYTIPFSSGLIAGDSLTAVSINLIHAAPAIAASLWQSFFSK